MPEICGWKLSCGSGNAGEASGESQGSTRDKQSWMAGPFGGGIRLSCGHIQDCLLDLRCKCQDLSR